jgi:LPXTG-motif cell wall-anchored protein
MAALVFSKKSNKEADSLKKKMFSILIMAAMLLTTFIPASATSGNVTDPNITLEKTAVETNGCREFEVELTIKGTPVQKPIDVILVIDRSLSMGQGPKGQTPMDYAKAAALSFVDTVLADSDNRVGIVSYGSDATLHTSLTKNKKKIEDAINGLSVSGYTNIKAAFNMAEDEMRKSDRPKEDVNRAIILLSDGIANQGGGIGTGSFYPTEHNSHTRAAYNAGISAQSEATVFTVGLLGDIASNREDSLDIARDTLKRAQNGGYYETLAAAGLSDIYQKISQTINNAGTNASVTDEIADEFILVGDSLQASSGTTASVDEENESKIIWNIGNIGSTPITLKYRIKIKKDITDARTDVATNKYAKLNYTNINDQPAELLFPVPTVSFNARLTADAGADRTIRKGESTSLGSDPSASGGYPEYSYSWNDGIDKISDEANPTVSPEETTTYTLTVTDEKGCTATDPVTVTVVEDEAPVIGKVTVRYLDEYENDIISPIVITGDIGEPYKTEKKAFEGYTFVDVSGEEEGEFTEEDIMVIYFYAKDDDDPDPTDAPTPPPSDPDPEPTDPPSDPDPEPTPTPEPTASPTPVPFPRPTTTPVEEEDIEDDEIPGGSAGDEDDEIILDDDDIPGGAGTLPKTGGFPPIAYLGFGSVLVFAGFWIRRKSK